ncbi:MAG: RagB/SusD family nutrient uptake outer membrane protein [Flavobacteriaceae bacterium]|nr:RagB/SusD family nutrient uptake outer membrane protein [Flavobacteriaceae bacterium]
MRTDFVHIILIFTLLQITFSCSKFLDLVPDNIATIDIAFEKQIGAERFKATLYGYLPNFTNPLGGSHTLWTGDEAWMNDIAYNILGTNQTTNQKIPLSHDIARGFQSSNNPILSSWSSLYVAIRDCNIFLENIDNPIDMDDFLKNQWAAEAKVLKAYYHFYLMRQYGPIPIVDVNLPVDTDPSNSQIPRRSVDEVVDYIVNLIDEAVPDLPQVTVGNADYGTINQSSALAIKAQVLLTAASPLFNGNSDYVNLVNSEGTGLINSTFDATKWDRAAQACKEAIENAEQAGHSLYRFDELPSLSETTNLKMSIRGAYTSEVTTEVVFPATGRTVSDQSAFIAPLDFPTGNTDFQLQSVISAQFSPTLRVAEMFYSENGVPIEEDTSYDFNNRYQTEIAPEDDPIKQFYVQPGFTTAKLNLDREPRFYASLGFDGGIWYGQGNTDDTSLITVRAKYTERAGAKNLPSFNRFSATGYFAKKLVHYETTMAGGNNIVPLIEENYPWPIIRLADIYLMYAEALNESLASPNAEVYKYIDLVRERAGLNGVIDSWSSFSSNPSKPTTKDGMREIIHQERMIELVFEGSRFWDLRRWKKAIDLMSKPIRGWNVFGDTADLYYNVQTIYQPNFSIKDYLWPIDLPIILRNSNLIQNPGW